LQWEAVKGATSYVIYANAQQIGRSSDLQYTAKPGAAYQVVALNAQGLASFASEPLWVGGSEQVELEQATALYKAPLIGFSGKGVIEISTTANRSLRFVVNVPAKGNYLLDMRYANGSGPWNTDNKCAQRTLAVNGAKAGVLVFPQRGKDEWSNWGYSNVLLLPLEAGKNEFTLTFDPWNENMNGEVNRALLDFVRLRKVE
jgi:hypothetical protein